MKTRTTNVVRNDRCASSRYTLKLSLIFFLINQRINERMNQQSISRMAHPPLKIDNKLIISVYLKNILPLRYADLANRQKYVKS